MADDRALREQLVAAVRRLDQLGLNRGSTGNASVRGSAGGGYWITPTGMGAEIGVDDLVWMGDDGSVRGTWRPSSEAPFHRAVYAARADLHAVVHAHCVHATALACLRKPLPAFHYMVAVAGGDDIRCAPYATFGTQALSDHAVAALEGRRACLLANHGMIAIGGSLGAALALAVEVETLAEMYWRAQQLGEPVLLSPAEMEVVVAKFRTYGQPGS